MSARAYFDLRAGRSGKWTVTVRNGDGVRTFRFDGPDAEKQAHAAVATIEDKGVAAVAALARR